MPSWMFTSKTAIGYPGKWQQQWQQQQQQPQWWQQHLQWWQQCSNNSAAWWWPDWVQIWCCWPPNNNQEEDANDDDKEDKENNDNEEEEDNRRKMMMMKRRKTMTMMKRMQMIGWWRGGRMWWCGATAPFVSLGRGEKTLVQWHVGLWVTLECSGPGPSLGDAPWNKATHPGMAGTWQCTQNMATHPNMETVGLPQVNYIYILYLPTWHWFFLVMLVFSDPTMGEITINLCVCWVAVLFCFLGSSTVGFSPQCWWFFLTLFQWEWLLWLNCFGWIIYYLLYNLFWNLLLQFWHR